LYADICQ